MPSSKFYETIFRWRDEKLVIGCTNGCFDLLHEGHRHLLSEARKHCDALAIIINTDESVKRLKGQGRPIEHLQLRGQNLQSLYPNDPNFCLGTISDERDLLEYIKIIHPDVLIKGSDYHGLSITGAGYVQKYGGKVVLIPLLPGYSTTKIVENQCH